VAVWNILQPFGMFNGHLVCLMAIWYVYGRLVYFVFIWYISLLFGMFYLEKSGNPERLRKKLLHKLMFKEHNGASRQNAAMTNPQNSAQKFRPTNFDRTCTSRISFDQLLRK
jgi:hypothetical protein